MKVRGSGFKLGKQVIAPEASFQEFFKWLIANKRNTIWPYDSSRARSLISTLWMAEVDQLYAGFFLSYRNKSKSHFFEAAADDITVEARDDSANNRGELNFFCIKKSNWTGMYSSHNGSYPMSNFLSDFWHVYASWVKQRHTMLPEADRKARKREFSIYGRNECGVLASQLQFEKLIERLKTLSAINFHVFSAERDAGLPHSDKVESTKHSLIYGQGVTADDTVVSWIRAKAQECIKRRKSGTATEPSISVSGKTASGEPMTIPLEGAIDDFLRLDYDNLGTVTFSKLEENECIKAMMNLVETEALFL